MTLFLLLRAAFALGDVSVSFTPAAPRAGDHIDVTVTALDAEDNVIEEKSFADVPIQAGYITTFKGTFFVTTGMSFSFQSSGDWTDYDEITF